MICCTTKQVRSMGLFLVWLHKLLFMHVYKDLLWCKSIYDVKPGIDPGPLLARTSFARRSLVRSSFARRSLARFKACKKSWCSLKRRTVFQTGAKIYLSEKIFWGFVHFNFSTTIIHMSPVSAPPSQDALAKWHAYSNNHKIPRRTLRQSHLYLFPFFSMTFSWNILWVSELQTLGILLDM